MATQVKKNWLSRMKKTLKLASDEENTEVSSLGNNDDIRAALQRQMAKEVLDQRVRNLAYWSSVR